MKITLAIDRPGFLPPVKEYGGPSALLSLKRLMIHALEWLGSLLEGEHPVLPERVPDLAYWRIHGWPF